MRENQIILIKQGPPRTWAQKQFVKIPLSRAFDYSSALNADQRFVDVVNPRLKAISPSLPPDHETSDVFPDPSSNTTFIYCEPAHF